jgi:type IV pilus assembly protein PilM
MARRVVGLDIGSASVRAVEVENPGSSHPKITHRIEMDLPPGAARYGEVVEPEVVAGVLKAMWADGNFKSKKVVLGIGGQRMMARDLTVPKMPLRRIRETLAFQVQDMLPVPVSDVLLDFYPIEDVEGDGPPMVAGLLVAALKETVRVNIRAVELAGLTPVDVDILPFALTRALKAELDSDGVVALIEVGASATSVVVSKARVPRFVRIVPRGGGDLTDRLADEIGIDHLQAEQVKVGLALGFEGEVPDYLVEAAGIVETYQRDLLHGLRNTLGYYATTHPEVPIERIVLTGGGARMTGFEFALQRLSGIPVERGRPFASVPTVGRSAVAPDADDHRLAAALGLALGSTR